MNRSLFRITVYLQLGMMILLATGCAPTQPFFMNESPDLQHYLNTATSIEYPDVNIDSLAETTQSMRPLTIGNHDYQFWDVTLEECVSIALANAKFFVTTSGNAESRQNIAAQFVSGTADQFGSIYDVPVQQSTTQSVPLTVDGSGNRLLPRNVVRANQVGGVEDALAEFDAQASGFINYSTTDRPQNVGIGNTINPVESRTQNMTQQAAISKRGATGGVFTLRQQIIYSDSNAQISNFGRSVPSDYTAVLEAQVQHPLMRNRGTLINRIPVVLASLNEDISIAEFEAQVRNLVRDVENNYWDLYVAYRNVATTTIGRNSAIATAQFARLNLENGTGTVQELAQAEEQYYQFRARLEGALAGSNLDDRFGVYGRERALRELMGLAPTDGRLIRPIDEPSVAHVEFDWCESVAQALYLSPELRSKKVRIKQNELELMSAKNQILPEVNLSLLYRGVGVGDTLGPPNGSDVREVQRGSSALSSFTSGDYQEGAIRLEITPPAFGGRRELARIRNAQLRLVREKGYLQESERLLVSQLSDAVAKTATHYRLMETHSQRWQAAEREVEARLAEFETGRSPVNVVLQSQQRKADAQVAYYRALGEYNKSLNYVDYLKGTMLVNSGITLAEGPWNSKAYCDALERARERSAGKEMQYGVTRPSVVRTGPVRDAAGALDLMARQKPTLGQTIGAGLAPVQQRDIQQYSDEIIHEQIPSHFGSESLRRSEPAIIDSVPLSDMGTPQEMFSPSTTDVQIENIVPDEMELEDMQRRTMPLGNPTIQGTGESILNAPAVETVLPSEGRVDQVSYQAGDIGVENAPSPVRRRPLPR
ncbi:TolC family protein [Planctomycetes bacterium K23_9]|uniref:Outer membrane efflux protein n=1 Tax=Stieleria marina TaxID=1930275 RepID=A0A517NQU7_9BACT|nr:Outer membrane efflux protein [Planctomycetes bacterium K23_9]